MRDMFRDVVTHRARLRNSIVAPFASIPVLIVSVVACWSLFTFALPMPVVEAINFVQVDVRPPALPSPPTRRDDVASRPISSSPNITPINAPDGFTPESQRVVVVADNLPIDQIPGSESLPAAITTELKPVTPPPAPVVSQQQQPVAVGGLVKAPTRTNSVAVEYPAIARAARVQGVVIIEATISTSGRVIDAKILRSIPLLDAAALDAVKQWEFTTPTLNGQPVPVVMTVTVNFTLQ
ncbi:MAG: energy transducer TonB [Acidobacteriota bacterium]